MAKNQEQNQNGTGNKPAAEYRAGKVKVSIWETKKNHEGREYIDYSVSLEKSYKDKDGNWQSQKITLFPDELPHVGLVTEAAFRHISLK